jgi:type I site-specific restriction endonuclease
LHTKAARGGHDLAEGPHVASAHPRKLRIAKQQKAIRHVCETFVTGRRRALIVAAVGTGKTQTTMALVDLFLRARDAQKALSLSDGDALVEQAFIDGIQKYLPNEPRNSFAPEALTADQGSPAIPRRGNATAGRRREPGGVRAHSI